MVWSRRVSTYRAQVRVSWRCWAAGSWVCDGPRVRDKGGARREDGPRRWPRHGVSEQEQGMRRRAADVELGPGAGLQERLTRHAAGARRARRARCRNASGHGEDGVSSLAPPGPPWSGCYVAGRMVVCRKVARSFRYWNYGRPVSSAARRRASRAGPERRLSAGALGSGHKSGRSERAPQPPRSLLNCFEAQGRLLILRSWCMVSDTMDCMRGQSSAAEEVKRREPCRRRESVWRDVEIR